MSNSSIYNAGSLLKTIAFWLVCVAIITTLSEVVLAISMVLWGLGTMLGNTSFSSMCNDVDDIKK